MNIGTRLAQDTIVIIDGAMTTEMDRRGAPMDMEVWGGAALLSHPDIVREVHADYVRNGAEVQIACTYNTAPHIIERSSLDVTTHELNTIALEMARRGIEDAEPDHAVWVAGSISTAVESANRTPIDAATLRDSYKRQAESLAELGCDLLVLEMMLSHAVAIDLDFQVEIPSIAKATDLPVWAGFSPGISPNGVLHLYQRGPESSAELEQSMAAMLADSVDVASIMHCEVEAVTPALRLLSQHWHGPVAVYPNSGQYHRPHWVFDSVMSPADFAAAALEWAEQGANAIGGCCGLGPNHIASLVTALKTTGPG